MRTVNYDGYREELSCLFRLVSYYYFLLFYVIVERMKKIKMKAEEDGRGTVYVIDFVKR